MIIEIKIGETTFIVALLIILCIASAILALCITA